MKQKAELAKKISAHRHSKQHTIKHFALFTTLLVHCDFCPHFINKIWDKKNCIYSYNKKLHKHGEYLILTFPRKILAATHITHIWCSSSACKKSIIFGKQANNGHKFFLQNQYSFSDGLYWNGAQMYIFVCTHRPPSSRPANCFWKVHTDEWERDPWMDICDSVHSVLYYAIESDRKREKEGREQKGVGACNVHKHRFLLLDCYILAYACVCMCSRWSGNERTIYAYMIVIPMLISRWKCLTHDFSMRLSLFTIWLIQSAWFSMELAANWWMNRVLYH